MMETSRQGYTFMYVKFATLTGSDSGKLRWKNFLNAVILKKQLV